MSGGIEPIVKLKATIASFLIAAACCVFARATDSFPFPDSTDNNAIPAYDGGGLLIPRLDERSGGNRETGWSGQTGDSSYLSKSKPAYRSNVRTEKVSSRTAAAAPSPKSDNHRPWAVVLIAVGGLVGAIGAVAAGRWSRVYRRRQARSFVPALLAASLRENQPRIAKPSKIAEQQTNKTRRAA